MITLLQIDKSGGDLFDKNYSIVLIKDKKEAFGINIPEKTKNEILDFYRQGSLNIEANSEKNKKNRLRLRFHTAIVIKLIEAALRDIKEIDEVNFQICNDFDGHFHEIKDMIFKNINRFIKKLKPEDILQTKFQKPSFIDSVGRDFRESNKINLRNYTIVNIKIEELVKIIKK